MTVISCCLCTCLCIRNLVCGAEMRTDTMRSTNTYCLGCISLILPKKNHLQDRKNGNSARKAYLVPSLKSKYLGSELIRLCSLIDEAPSQLGRGRNTKWGKGKRGGKGSGEGRGRGGEGTSQLSFSDLVIWRSLTNPPAPKRPCTVVITIRGNMCPWAWHACAKCRI